jgi:hypothetical protein
MIATITGTAHRKKVFKIANRSGDSKTAEDLWALRITMRMRNTAADNAPTIFPAPLACAGTAGTGEIKLFFD